MKLRGYKRELDYSYSFGVFPTLELFKHRPEVALRVIAHTKGDRSRGIGQIEALCAAHHVPFEVHDKTVERFSHKGNIYVFAVFAKYQSELTAGADHLLLERIADMGNLGASMRTMLGFGLRDLALISPAADAFNPHAVRASMGAVFALNTAYFEDVAAYRRRFTHKLYPFTPSGTRPLGEVAFERPFTLLFGAEGPGLLESSRELGESVVIAHGPLIESLNLAVAVGIGLFEATREAQAAYVPKPDKTIY